ncbi:TetR/AcrR family transcriptional regulator [Pseudodesulfovibrio sp.]|uniref:TetR/AcrR family transcriptional regulator n=1 Tax=Pseudodesulfovibrio sp. TaxID=2035812 RepID=UPI0026374A3C|nr:TetR/AcrR family transcriptional regulator [Pseudodesulfovibrio sp.]MDD3311418.1 TetR/AcrR family transcriptional regulator [Pseudodesulfovibrio sp.]
MPNSPSSRRGPGRPPDPDKRSERRKTILTQAVTHFARDGFARTDVAAVAEAAGCSKGTVYNYFENKQALFRDAVDHVMDGLVKATSDPEDEGSVEGFGRAIEAFLRYFDENPAYIELLIQERAVFKDRAKPTYLEYCDTHRDEHKGFFEKLSAEGVFRQLSADRLFDIISDLLYGTIFTNYFAKRKTCLEQQASDITDLLLNGLLARP